MARDQLPAPAGFDEGRIILSNRMPELARAGAWLAEWTAARRLPAAVVFAMRLCLEEVLANIVGHGFAGGEHAIVVDLRCDADEAVLTVTDDGRPFNPIRTAAPVQAVGLAEAEPGGRGLILLNRYASRLAYGRDDGRNRLDLGFALPGGTPRQEGCVG